MPYHVPVAEPPGTPRETTPWPVAMQALLGPALRLIAEAAVVGVVVLAGLEVALRVAGLPTNAVSNFRRIYDLDQRAMGPFLPNASARLASFEFAHEVSTNSLGCRGQEPSLADRKAILCVGDSYTFGYGVADADTWPAQLGARLDAAGASRAIVNLSSGHLIIDDQVEFLKRALPVVHPDVVVLMVPGTGYFDPIDAMKETPHQRSLRRARARRGLASALWRGSALSEVADVSKRWRTRLKQIATGQYPPRLGGADPERYRPLLPRFTERLEEFRAEVEGAGARFVLVCFPILDVHEGTVRFVEPWTLACARPDDAAVVDVAAAFHAAGGGNRLLLLPYDLHTSPRGNRVIADAVFEALRAAGLV